MSLLCVASGAGSDEQPEEDRFDIRKAEALLEKEGLPEEYRRKIEQKIADEEARLEAAEATARVGHSVPVASKARSFGQRPHSPPTVVVYRRFCKLE